MAAGGSCLGLQKSGLAQKHTCNLASGPGTAIIVFWVGYDTFCCGAFVMIAEAPSLSTDQLAALVELHQQGSLRAAAETLFITEQGVRNRLVALEERLGVELYRKRRG